MLNRSGATRRRFESSIRRTMKGARKMNNTRPTVQDVPEHILDMMAREVSLAMDAFYADPANEAAFQAWKREQEAKRNA